MLSSDSSAAGVFCTPLRSFANFNSLVSVVKRQLSKIKTPALIIHPREDDIADIDNAYYLQRKLGGLVDMVVLDDSYHIITLYRQRSVVVERSVEFAHAVAADISVGATTVQPVQINAAE